MGLKCKHGLSVDAYCSMCFNEKQMPIDSYFQARAEEAGELGLRNPTRETPEPYLSGYRAGWNDSISQLIKSINDLTVYGRLGNDYVEKMDLMIVIKRLLKQ